MYCRTTRWRFPRSRAPLHESTLNIDKKMSFERAFQYFHGYIRSFLRPLMGTSSDVFDYFHDDN
jgi:hypothetical protein